MAFAAVWVAFAACCLLVSEARGSRRGVWIFKPLASAGFVAAAAAAGAPASLYGALVLGALLLSFAGDVLLIPPGSGTFRLGLLSFLLAQLTFAAAFIVAGVDLRALTIALPAGAVLGGAIFAWLRPYLGARLRGPVAAYVVSIVAMASLAASTASAAAAAGAVMFMAADTVTARNRFVAPGLVNRLWSVPLYYAAQLLLASTPSGISGAS